MGRQRPLTSAGFTSINEHLPITAGDRECCESVGTSHPDDAREVTLPKESKMLEVEIPQQTGESMVTLRQRVRAFCESKRIPFEQAGQVPQALAIFVADEATQEIVQQEFSVPLPAVAVSSPAETKSGAPAASVPVQPQSDDLAPRGPRRRETLRPSGN
jgi:hypothetical protein